MFIPSAHPTCSNHLFWFLHSAGLTSGAPLTLQGLTPRPRSSQFPETARTHLPKRLSYADHPIHSPHPSHLRYQALTLRLSPCPDQGQVPDT